MPIYFSKTKKDSSELNTKPIKYFDKTNLQATQQTIVHFGFGDIVIAPAKHRFSSFDEINFFDAVQAGEIGKNNPDTNGKEAIAPVRLVFDKPSSIDVLINELEKLKEIFLDCPVWIDISKETFNAVFKHYDSEIKASGGFTEPNHRIETIWEKDGLPFLYAITTYKNNTPKHEYFVNERFHGKDFEIKEKQQ